LESDVEQLVRKLVKVEDELERKWAEQREKFSYRLEDGRAVFEEAVRLEHLSFKRSLFQFLINSPLGAIIAAPFVYGLVVPIILLDVGVTLYQQVSFRIWGVKRCDRSDFVVVDRHRLGYLNGIEKLNCLYCGYANGVIAYAREAASRTEQYWCPIKHALRVRNPHVRYRNFTDYGDAEGFRARLEELRDEVRAVRRNAMDQQR